jgi:hypothetical protein
MKAKVPLLLIERSPRTLVKGLVLSALFSRTMGVITLPLPVNKPLPPVSKLQKKATVPLSLIAGPYPNAKPPNRPLVSAMLVKLKLAASAGGASNAAKVKKAPAAATTN